MFSYILSFFHNPQPELSLEESCGILTENFKYPEEVDNGIIKDHEETLREISNFSTKTGTITAKQENNTYVIDDLYKFQSNNEEFQIGAIISYQKLSSDGEITIYNVTQIQDEWNIVQEKDSILSSRIMVCKVEKRDKRTLILSPGDIELDLNSISIEFIPIVGDWLELDVKHEVDENSLNLSGKVIEVNKVSPIRPHIQSGKVTFWDPFEYTGIINKNIFFTKNSLSCGYMPVVGDKVVAEVIESDQPRCAWRALKLILENIKKKVGYSTLHRKKVEENHSGLEISDVNLNFNKIGERREFTITLTNKSSENLKFINAELEENFGQINLLENNPCSVDILPGKNLNLNLLCVTRNVCRSNECLMLNFEGFTVIKCINVNVGINMSHYGGFYQKKFTNNYKNGWSSNEHVIRGQKSINVRFPSKRIPNYALPKHLYNLVINCGGERYNLIKELQAVKKSLFENLSSFNYEEKFHMLLYLDEIAQLIFIRQYDQEQACFIPNNEFLMLEIENLAERRPSIVLGDKIHASDPLKVSKNTYEGNVFKIGAKYVYLKFSELFHQMYKGEDYSIKVVPGRVAYKRQHHAISLVTRFLGKEWLFPMKIIEKHAQINFCYDPYPNVISSQNSVKSKKSIQELIRLVNEFKANKAVMSDMDEKGTECKIEDSEKVLKLEWYNTKLNCKQKDAVINILKGLARPLPYIIFGPPGTGKTVTLIESILQIIRMVPGSRILVTAPSNSAADLIALRLVDSGVLKPGDLIRLVSINYASGEQIPPKLMPYCVTANSAVEGTTEENVVTLNGLTLDCNKFVLGRHKITVSTCSSVGQLYSMDFPRGHFTHIFVDEAGQATETDVMIPLSFLDKYNGQAILAGDPMQLGPVVLCKVAEECGLNESFLERLLNRFPYIKDNEGFPETEGVDPRLLTKLLYNYRSLSVILRLFSTMFYNGDLIPTISDKDSKEFQLLQSLSSILPKTKDDEVPSIVFHGVDGQNFQTADSPSWFNPHEAAQIFFYVNELYRLGVKSENVGIITPYVKQVREIRLLLREAEFPIPKIGTVEDFQGQEFEVILLSTVRSSEEILSRDLEYSLGFVSNPKRLNVAISRPKALLVIVGNPMLLYRDAHWRTVINYCVEKGAYTGCHW